MPVSHPLGGIRTYMLYSFKRLHDEGIRFTFLSEAGAAFQSFKQDLIDWEGTEFIDIPAGSGNKGSFFSIRKALQQSEFALIHSQGLRSGTEAAVANFLRRIPHFITLHDVIVPMNDIPGRFRAIKRFIISQTTRRATTIIPVSHDCAENHLQVFPAWKHGPVKIETILNGINLDRLDRSRKIYETENRSAPDSSGHAESKILQAGFFGRFMPQKGFDILLEALAILVRCGYGERLRLMATKDPNGFLNETVSAAARQPEVARMIQFIDPRPDIAPLLLQCDLCVIPSRWEACPILPMEALVLGTPVIGTDCLGLREVLKDTPSLVAVPGDAESLAEKLMAFIENPTTEAARNYMVLARQRFTVQKTSEALLALYGNYL